MKVIVFSDVHGNQALLERIISFNPDADYFLSLGDSELSMDYLLDLDIIGVKGNYPRDAGVGYDHQITLNGLKILMTHGHKYGVQRSLKKLLKAGFDGDYDLILYGHTHIAKVDKVSNLTLINPGSVYRPRSKVNSSYLTLEINEDKTYTDTFKEAETNQLITEL